VDIPGLSSRTVRTAAILPLLAALSACVSAGRARTAGLVGDRESVVERGPRVQIWTTDELGTGNRVRTSFRLNDDAYVIVVNVGLDGYANVIFPESPDDDGFMRGGRTYRLPAFFPGFANSFSRSRYARLYNTTSMYDGVYDRYAGYVFILASWRPMHFKATEALGLWDDYRLAAHERHLEPYVVMQQFADQLVQRGARDYTARFARYAAFRGGFAGRSFSSCAVYSSGFGYVPLWAFPAFASSWVPLYGIDYYGAWPGCGYGYVFRFASLRPRGQPIVAPPVRPTPGPVSGDTATKPRPPRRPRSPVARPDSGERKHPKGGRRVEAAIEEEAIIDVTNDTRDLARRRAWDADAVHRAARGERAYQRADEWRRAERARRSERSDAWRDEDRGDGGRARQRAPVEHERVRRETSREESRSTEPREPRRDPPPRPEPRSQPRAEPRQEARPQPAAKPEPRSERPAKPAAQH
jgi:hypothetical protein